jgi:putative phosphoesterase
MMIGVVSDTHGHKEFAHKAVRMLESCQVELVIHCGDIGSTEIVKQFSAWPTHFVLGNVDSNVDELREAIAAAGQTLHGRFGTLELEGRKIAFLHGDDDRRLRETIANGQYDLVCYGHTHVARLERHSETLALNPGALYRAQPHSLAVVSLGELAVTHVNL